MNPDPAPAAGNAPSGGRARLPVTDSVVLVVDDIEWNRALIGTLLEEAGYTRVLYAVDGLDALDKIQAHKPDLIILDIMMPGIDGFEVCRRLRADHDYADLPVLVQTALSGVEDRNRAFESGTTDLVTKPLDRFELMARVNIHLENRALIRNLQLYRERVEGELATARGIFEHLLPSGSTISALEQASGLSIQSHMVRSSELGGDIWGAFDLGGGRFGVYLLDPAGRGVSAALNVCRLHTLVRELTGLAGQPAQFLAELNRRACDLLTLGEHASMIYGVVSPVDGRFTYASAAATGPVLMVPGHAPPRIGEGAGLPLGVSADAVFEAHDIEFPPGAGILLHSNAILDALDDGRPGDAVVALTDTIGQAAVAEPGKPFAGIVERFDAVVGSSPRDDHTLVWLGH